MKDSFKLLFALAIFLLGLVSHAFSASSSDYGSCVNDFTASQSATFTESSVAIRWENNIAGAIQEVSRPA
ncbi:hypothetical protein OKW21_000718 [Catalinimonas alkaloidigena]|uniref:hypothetical protein n=1 Tax=Catalinimonas alkaloidigena TaxID=1075417 RepID=UPI00240633EA|nr:hypothetical protein [Catalinimonas alkaloidigena]MDF9795455.1 hypothetical protein [Catalinimonas alkaloidigena]